MKTALYTASLLFLAALMLLVQHAIPPVELFHGARINLLPALVAFVALTLDFPWAIAFAFCLGLVWDALTIPYVSGEPQLAFGLTIVVFGVATILLHGCRTWFLQGRFYLHPLLSGLLASGTVALEYLLISLERGSLYFDATVPWRILVPGMLNLCLAPLLLWTLWMAAGLFGLPLRLEKSPRRYTNWAR